MAVCVDDDQGRYDVNVCVHVFEGLDMALWSTGQTAGGGVEEDASFAASDARAWASHASRVLWSTGQASLSDIVTAVDYTSQTCIVKRSTFKSAGQRC